MGNDSYVLEILYERRRGGEVRGTPSDLSLPNSISPVFLTLSSEAVGVGE